MPDLVKPEQKMTTLRTFFDQNKNKVGAILPRHLSLNRQGQLLFTAVYRDPNLLDCTPASLVGALIQGGMLGLEPIGAGGYYLVPFYETKRDRRNVTMIVDYRAVLSLARNSKEITSFDVQPVYEKDHFDYVHGTHPKLEHKPKLGGDRGKPIAYYMVAALKGGGVQFEVMSVDEVQRHKDRFSKTWKNLPMSPDLDWYGLKTVIKQGCKMLPMSIQALTAIAVDDKADLGIDQDLGSLLEDGIDTGGEGATSKPSKLDTLKTELKKENGHAATAKGAPPTDESAPSPGETSESTPTPAAATTKPPAPADEAPPRSTAPAPVQAKADRAESAGAGPGGTPQQSTVTSPDDPRLPFLASIAAHFKTLGMEGDHGTPRLKREWISSRFLGAGVKLDAAPVEALGKLDAELGRLVELRAEKK